MSAIAALAEHGIHADRDGLHVMPPEQLQGATSMQEECKEFLAKTKQFNDIVGDFIDVMESKSKVIEAEKLRAIGFGNRVGHEKEVGLVPHPRLISSTAAWLVCCDLHHSLTEPEHWVTCAGAET